MIVKADKLAKRFNREWIFRNFTHDFQPGIYAVTGPNGSGKSTLLQVLWSQLPASSGTLHYEQEGKIIEADRIYRHLVIAAPYMNLIEELTLDEILRFHFSFKRSREGRSVEELMQMMELSHARNKPIAQFSSGMKQRLKLGLAFFSEADIIFLDEPTTNLDKKAVEWYWQHLTGVPAQTLIFIGSNTENEYPEQARKIYLPEYK
ncbi:MAG: ABC transporter ATP-binding protein [Bacteroidetes bacterium]|nr:ABC transporter ATP-binding protein [Bacteroidota bacterium]